MEAYPNLYCDLSAGSGAGALKRDPRFAAEFLVRRQGRLMFGSDYLAPRPAGAAVRGAQGDRRARRGAGQVYRENARRLLKL
jgi:predicted TIM-barrel fold metal-dependent hydrolase